MEILLYALILIGLAAAGAVLIEMGKVNERIRILRWINGRMDSVPQDEMGMVQMKAFAEIVNLL